jgi:hypothetical protein
LPDIPGNSSTTASITVGGTANEVLETIGDHDWFRITLTAGQKVTITVDGISLEDPLVRILNSGGTVLDENDDISSGVVRDSRLVFTAPSTGTYYIDVGAFADDYSGTYTLAVNNWAPPPVATIDTIAHHLTDGYWGGDRHQFNASQGGTITVNLTGLTPTGQTLARDALALWSDVIGITFSEVVGSSGQIVFDDNQEGAFTEGTWSNGITSVEHVNISTQWIATYGSGIGSYSFQTYIHEIGHALGLGHGGYYNTTATYADDAEFANDGWPTTVMSYFDQQDNTYFANQGFSFGYLSSPMVADIRAMATLYGLSTTTRTGDTTYGFGNNSGRAIYTASVGAVLTGYTVVDSGGIDTLNYSGFASNQWLDLNSEAFSNVGGGIGNVSIGFGTVIENAIGGSGDDFLFGNVADNMLTGGSGNDTISGNGGADVLIGGLGVDILTGGIGGDAFQGTTADLSGDTIADFQSGDRIVFTNASLASFTFNLSGSTLTYSGGSLILTGGISGQLTASAAAGGGVQLTLDSPAINDVRNDFNGDGRSDILWRNETGAMSEWLGQPGGTFAYNPNAAYQLPTNWDAAATGDFNGDGRDDIMWRNETGAMSEWLGQTNGTFAYNPTAAYQLPTSWDVAATGDFNGDGRDDIMWRNETGAMSEWLGQTNGTFAYNPTAAYQLPTSWDVAATGDFNGDGRDDIMWRNETGAMSEWLGQTNGTFAYNPTAAHQLPTNWDVAATGDFNGDGRDDILWRNETGAMSEWLAQPGGTFAWNPNAAYQLPTSWQLATTGDFNGDGRDDLLWRNDVGAMSQWLGQSDGTFVYNPNAAYQLPTSWHAEPEHLLL